MSDDLSDEIFKPGKYVQQLSRALEAQNVVVLDDEARRTALEMAKKLVTTLETPQETVMRYAWEVCFPLPWQ